MSERDVIDAESGLATIRHLSALRSFPVDTRIVHDLLVSLIENMPLLEELIVCTYRCSSYVKIFLECLPGFIIKVCLNVNQIRHQHDVKERTTATPRDHHGLESLRIHHLDDGAIAEYVLLPFLDTCRSRLKFETASHGHLSNKNLSRAFSRLGIVLTEPRVPDLPRKKNRSTDAEIAEAIVSNIWTFISLFDCL